MDISCREKMNRSNMSEEFDSSAKSVYSHQSDAVAIEG